MTTQTRMQLEGDVGWADEVILFCCFYFSGKTTVNKERKKVKGTVGGLRRKERYEIFLESGKMN